MKKTFYKTHSVCFFLFFLFLLPAFALDNNPRIRVVTDDASIRMRPAIESDIIESSPRGSEYEIKGKIGEWYEIQFRSRVGVMIFGYLHEDDVEVVAPPPTPEPVDAMPSVTPSPDSKIKFTLKAGGLFSFGKIYDHKHSIPLYQERLTISNLYETSPAFGVNLGAGVFINPAFEVTANIDFFFSQSDPGLLRIDVPNPNRFNDHKSDESKTSLSPQKFTIGFGVNFHPDMDGMIRLYLGAGGKYIQSKMDLVTGFSFNLRQYQDGRHSVELTNLKYEEASFSKFGFDLRAGINLELTNNMLVFGEGNYTIAKTDIQYPLYKDDQLEVNLGGFIFYTGLTFAF